MTNHYNPTKPIMPNNEPKVINTGEIKNWMLRYAETKDFDDSHEVTRDI